MMKSIIGALGSLALFSVSVRAQEEALAKFGDTVEILGKVSLSYGSLSAICAVIQVAHVLTKTRWNELTKTGPMAL